MIYFRSPYLYLGRNHCLEAYRTESWFVLDFSTHGLLMETEAMDVTSLFKIFVWKQEGEKIEFKELCFKMLY